MDFGILNNKISIESNEDFIPDHILDCGQVFRYEKIPAGYKIFSKNLFCSLIYEDSRVIIDTSDVGYFVDYFDLNRDYGAIKSALSGYSDTPIMKNALQHGKGLRLLKQDPTEMIVSFIISANNNIPRIKGILKRLTEALGEKTADGYAFPSVLAMSEAGERFYTDIGCGYRAKYLDKTSKALANGFELDLDGMSDETAKKHLITLMGVGPKVADCILLFAYHRTGRFPTDVWVERVYDHLFGPSKKSAEQKSKSLSEHFGEMSGYAQQYLYYYARDSKLI